MADIQTIKLGGFVDEEVKKVNENFAALNDAIPEVPTNVGAFTNDAGYQTAEQVQEAVNSGVGNVNIPTNVSAFTNDAGYVKATDAAFLNKVDAEAGKGLSTKDYTAEDQTKVANLGKIEFGTSNFTAGTDGYWSASLAANGKYPVRVMRKNGTEYEEVLVHTKVVGTNIIIVSGEAFEGYVVTI